MQQFVHLRTQSSYSMLESTIKVKQLGKLASRHNMPAVALTDRNNLFGALEFSTATEQYEVQPINGAILNLKYPYKEQHKYAEIVLLAQNHTGHRNLLKLASYIYIKNNQRDNLHITIEDLASHAEGLICLSGYTKGPIGQALVEHDINLAEYFTRQFVEIFDDRFCFELMRHNLDIEKRIEHDYISLAVKKDIPIVATNIVLFEDISMFESHDILMCVKQGVKKRQTDRLTSHNQYYFKTQAEMEELFCDIKDAVYNTYFLAQRCSYAAEQHQPMLPSFSTGDITEEDLLRQHAYAGLQSRLDAKFGIENTFMHRHEKIKAEYFARLDYELSVICRMQFAGYFLIVSDFIKWSKQHGIMVGPGRGSGAGSIVAWSLLITDLDPIHYGLLFERFLNPERVSMPDFDIDFCQERRHEVIEYVRQKYGDARVAQIITFGTMQAKGVIKDVGRVLDLPYRYAHYISELVPFNAVNPVTLEQALEDVPELKQAVSGGGLYNSEFQDNSSFEDDYKEKSMNELIKEVLLTALDLEGLHRHGSIHAAGLIIAGVDIVEYVPLYKDMNSDLNVMQYSMKQAEAAGFVKFDFLGLQTLTVISKCCKLLEQKGIVLDLASLPLDDTKTFQMLSCGKSVGVFQFEGVGMRDALKRLKPDSLNDLRALTSLYRPGPMENLPTYIDCKHKRDTPKYLHHLVKDVLEETYGIMVYQEQVLEVARILAGYSLGAADLLRKAMGKKIKSEMDAQEKLFVAGCVNNQIDEDSAVEIFAQIAKFAGYGFNKSHATAYGLISYQMAYLKANHLTEFLIASLNLELNDHNKISLFINEAKSYDIYIAPPSINIAYAHFKAKQLLDNERESIIYGFAGIKGVTERAGELIANERELNGNFKDIIDFIERISKDKIVINKKVLESLTKAGSFDDIYPNRRELFENVEILLEYAVSYRENVYTQQLSLLDALNGDSSSKLSLMQYDEWSFFEKCQNQFEVLGFFLTDHPISLYQDLLKLNKVISTRDFDNLSHGYRMVRIAGVIEAKNTRMSGKGRFMTLKMSDQFSIFELTIFSDEVLKNYSELLEESKMVVVDCEANKTEGGIRLTATRFKCITELHNIAHRLDLYAKDAGTLSKLTKFLGSKQVLDDQKGNAEVYISTPIKHSFLSRILLNQKFQLNIEEVKMLEMQYNSNLS